MSALPSSFYQRDDVVAIARELIGAKLLTRINGILTAGIITETEAYNGRTDKACHAYGGRLTPRTEVMYRAGGIAYVYLCYGIHEMFNIVTNAEGLADAVLIRALMPTEGLEHIRTRRERKLPDHRLCEGPGTVTKGLAIDRGLNGLDLHGDTVWLETGIHIPDAHIEIGPRIGIDYADEDAKLPWRFKVEPDLRDVQSLQKIHGKKPS